MEKTEEIKTVRVFRPPTRHFWDRLMWSLWFPAVYFACDLLGILPYSHGGITLLVAIISSLLLLRALNFHYSIVRVFSWGISVTRLISTDEVSWKYVTDSDLIIIKDCCLGLELAFIGWFLPVGLMEFFRKVFLKDITYLHLVEDRNGSINLLAYRLSDLEASDYELLMEEVLEKCFRQMQEQDGE